jgi:hypothetical protein
MTIVQLMNDALTLGLPYRFNYPPSYDPSAPVKTISIEFDYSYVFKITAVNTSVPGNITYSTAGKHYLAVGNRVDITNTNPANYSFLNELVTAIPSAFQFTINKPSTSLPAYIGNGNVIQNLSTRSCETCECCCTFSLTNGLY